MLAREDSRRGAHDCARHVEVVENASAPKRRVLGTAKGDFVVPDDFDDPLPDEILAEFENWSEPSRMPMKNPPHPGLSVRVNCLEPFALSVTEGAKVLGVSRTTLSKLVNGQTGVSAEMAIRLAKAFGVTPEIWVRMQAAYDLAQARLHEAEIHVQPYQRQPVV